MSWRDAYSNLEYLYGLVLEAYLPGTVDSGHVQIDRRERMERIAALPKGEPVCELKVRAEKGPKLYLLLSNGVIEVYGLSNRKLITAMIANPRQVVKVFGNRFLRLPDETKNAVLAVCREHEKAGMCH